MNAPQSKSSTNEQQQNLDYFFTPRTASFAALATREFNDGLGGNLYLLLRLGIEAHACFPLLLHQLAKNGQDEFTVLLDLFVWERAERIEEYACGFFVGLGRGRECDLKFSLGHLIVVLWQRNCTISRESLKVSFPAPILIDVFHCANQSLDVDRLLPAHFGQGEDSKRPGANLRSLSRFPASFAVLSHVDLALLIGYAKLLRDW